MNNNEEQIKREFKDIIEMLDAAKGVKPKTSSFEALLRKIPSTESRRPALSQWIGHLSYIQRFSFVALAFVLIVTGVVVGQHASDTIRARSISDASITQDLNSLDAQMAALDSDNANTDQVIINQ
ncbi:MAG TPA: hypothetical protein VFT82_03205 [Candidatus Paceibacterota bacterium]|nr:hypothetical protein [Candidatus Paceibacterota bacterium]